MTKTERLSLIAVNVGSTRVAACAIHDGAPGDVVHAPSDKPAVAAELVAALASDAADEGPTAVVIASVNPPAARAFVTALTPRITTGVYLLGADLPIPQPHTLGADHTTGQDRLLNALAAFDTIREACVVVDAGTAVTVDFIDGEGVFHGGAIAPGARMQLAALHAGTASLPEVEFAAPLSAEPFPKTTIEAMRAGVTIGVRGMVRAMVERYAEAFGAYPRVIATGGDAQMLFAGDEFVDSVVPDLTLRGIGVAAREALAGEHSDARR